MGMNTNLTLGFGTYFTNDFTTHNETNNPEFAEELRRISAMDASAGLTNEDPMCGPIFPLPNILTHEIKIDTRFNEQIQKITEIQPIQRPTKQMRFLTVLL